MTKYRYGDGVIYRSTSWPPNSQPETELVKGTYVGRHNDKAVVMVDGKELKVNFSDIEPDYASDLKSIEDWIKTTEEMGYFLVKKKTPAPVYPASVAVGHLLVMLSTTLCLICVLFVLDLFVGH